MSTSTQLIRGVVHKLNTKSTVLDIHGIKGIPGVIHYNPGLCRDPKGNLWIAVRSCTFPDKPLKHNGKEHPMHYQNHLNVGILDEKTMTVTGMKNIKAAKDYDGFQWDIEDVRLFWREDGLHGIGVILPVRRDDYRTCQAEILIDYEKGTYTLVKDYGQPFNHPEKNWMPAENYTRLFDFIYSPTQIVVNGEVIGQEHHLDIHGGTPLLEFEGGYLSIGHVVTAIKGKRSYVQVACKWDKRGELKEISQFFHFDLGWREHLQETIEFVSGLVWAEERENEILLVGIGIKDELTAIAKVKMEDLEWQPYGDIAWYAWEYATNLSKKEIPTPATGLKGVHEHSLTTESQ